MKKITRQQLEERASQLAKDNGILIEAINAIANGESVSIGRKRNYTVSLIHPNRCHGGLVLLRYAPQGQTPYQSAHLFEEWFDYAIGQQTHCPSEDNAALRDLAYECKRAATQAQQVAA